MKGLFFLTYNQFNICVNDAVDNKTLTERQKVAYAAHPLLVSVQCTHADILWEMKHVVQDLIKILLVFAVMRLKA
jgi:hypothetical protein